MARWQRCQCRRRHQLLGRVPTAHTFCRRPKVRSRKIARRYRANVRCARARPNVRAYAGVPGQLCHRLRATALLPRESCRSGHVSFRLWRFVKTCDGGFNPAQALLQARGLAELAPPLGHLKRYERFTPWRAELRDAYATQARENSRLCEICSPLVRVRIGMITGVAADAA